MEKLAVTDQVLTVLGHLLQSLWFGFLDWLLQRLWVARLSSYMDCTLSVCVFSLSQWKLGIVDIFKTWLMDHVLLFSY